MKPFRVPLPNLQITFYGRLQEIRKNYLIDALLRTVADSEIHEIDLDLNRFVASRSLRKVAGWGLRGEILFPVPCLLSKQPKLLGYYRLLLGFSQKQFYGKEFGFGLFRAMEDRGSLSNRLSTELPPFCETLCKSAEMLAEGLDELSERSVHELTLLTLGPQLRGGVLNVLGAEAVAFVFDTIKAIAARNVTSAKEQSIEIRNAAGREVEIKFGSDPDISIREKLPSKKYRNLVAIEIKGGRDYSNIHNRLGEAEKSHQKARKQGFVECWTMINVSGLDAVLAQRESPSTDRFYDIGAVARPESEEFNDFAESLRARIGIQD
jgi:hypothetical protein